MCEVADESQNEINQSYCFKWNDYQNHLSDVVRQLLEDDCMVDVTLAAAGERIHAHRIVLSACSTLFQVIKSAKCVFVFDTILKHIKCFSNNVSISLEEQCIIMFIIKKFISNTKFLFDLPLHYSQYIFSNTHNNS